MKVILISGKAQNGKDTVAKMMQEQLKSDCHSTLIAHYADLLKYICRTYFGWDGKKDEAGRQMLQYVGTDVIRKKNPTLWVDFVLQMLQYFGDNWEYVIIPDCRFPNELYTMVESGLDTVYIRVIRSNFVSPLTPEQQKHPSETALDDVEPDFYINNDGTLDDLKNTVAEWVKENLYDSKARCS